MCGVAGCVAWARSDFASQARWIRTDALALGGSGGFHSWLGWVYYGRLRRAIVELIDAGRRPMINDSLYPQISRDCAIVSRSQIANVNLHRGSGREPIGDRPNSGGAGARELG